MQIDKKLYDEINEFCQINGLKTKDFIHKTLKEAFLKEKYGETPFRKNEAFITPIVVNQENIYNQVSTPPVVNETIQEVINEPCEKVLDTNLKEVTTDTIEVVETLSVSSQENVVKPKAKKKRTLK